MSQVAGTELNSLSLESSPSSKVYCDLSDRKGRNGTYGNPVSAPTAKQEREKRRRVRGI